jgi:hypothetical protein
MAINVTQKSRNEDKLDFSIESPKNINEIQGKKLIIKTSKLSKNFIF